MRRIAQLIAISLAAATMYAGLTPASARLGADSDGIPPNILVILTDDQALSTLQAMPATRRVFEDHGLSFTQAFATTPLCCPSRATIMSGRYAHNHTVRLNGQAPLLDQQTTVQRYLHDAGYKTAMAGKFLNGWDPAESPPHFDRSALLVPPDDSLAFLSHVTDGYYNVAFNVDGKLRKVKQYATDFVADRGAAFLNDFESDDDTPWYLYMAPYAPHYPYTVKPKYANARVPRWNKSPAVGERDLSDKPPWLAGQSGVAHKGGAIRAKQIRTLKSVDDLVADVFTQLEALGEAEDTLAVFMSDNGYLWGEHGAVQKQFPYTESAQIPLILRWPGHIAAAAQDDRVAGTVDITPTLLDAAGVTSGFKVAMDGDSLLGSTERDMLLLEYWQKEPGDAPGDWASLRAADYQYVEYYGANGKVIFKEYYDLVDDPYQLTNLLHDGNDRNDPDVQVLGAKLAELRLCAGTTCP
jgi:arylsulfatase A-like enzyme